MKRIMRDAVIEALVQTIADEQHGGDPYDIAAQSHADAAWLATLPLGDVIKGGRDE